ncbi:Helix-turn-helix domain protein [Clostridium neonatale]|uniref:helix-turn-helix domain-containing protein n=1 Tax=Clostridium neonatale TaxID=137838 RepID=UPI00291BE1A4|nr:helix-turn-helix transcriptional regulator [Clostridium neonatale]CAI3244091.1 Helix-turn-helix domain protein [Clostridium neonatale]CAI3539548.1 Helix-turn-helix domain protein [Clostridium neonatale]
MFNKRLEEYRDKLHLNKKEMSERIDICESYYSLLENGKRHPSRNVIQKLVVISELPEEYWIYGISAKEYVNTRDDFKSLKKALDTIFELTLFDNVDKIFTNNSTPDNTIEALLIAALKSDVESMIDKRKAKK